ncbi:DUF5009 domain-containing protein [uncultured Bacteroides sp.]|uniref:DUF5009 domain-containing protein n=1 Tax=uncultured Bacteroides sp. TaxID=162156 RepID=UPI002AA95448|nr:DUF5009 domain-containing protein [uncultured Bacteroides sp.]
MTTFSFLKRNAAIDLLRALTMFTMIFVNDFWKIHDVPHWLEHATYGEDFMGLADIVFPCFIFVMGMSIPFAIEHRYTQKASDSSTLLHILSRSFALLIMGVFITNSEARLSNDVFYSIGVYWLLMVAAFILIWNNYLPKSNKKLLLILKGLGWAILIFLAITFRSPDEHVFAAHWGILGSIGWTYLVCSLIYLFSRTRLKMLIYIWIGFLLLCMLISPMNESFGEIAMLNFPQPNFFHSFLEEVLHIGNGALPAFGMGGIVLSLLTIKYEEVPMRKKIVWILGLLITLIIAGTIARHFWILSKISATPTWIFYVSAIAIGVYTLLSTLVKAGKAHWLNIIGPAGTATLTVYLMPYVFYAFADITKIILPDIITHGFMGILNCLCFSLVVIGVTYLLGLCKIKLKI